MSSKYPSIGEMSLAKRTYAAAFWGAHPASVSKRAPASLGPALSSLPVRFEVGLKNTLFEPAL
jgi:hypothetical protein